LLLARLEQENNAIATDPKSGNKTRAVGQSRPPSVYQLQRLVQEQGAQSVRYSLLPAAAPMTELDFWAALVRDYPQTAQRLPTITSNKIRSGIPAPLRGVVWLSMAGARDKSIEEKYDKFSVESSPYERMIGKDVGRSFPQHDMFRDPDGEGQKMLGRVLKCYSLYDDKIGYCQGLGFLVGPLLMNMGDREAFCILVR
jgi:Rab-GTPase-TBC domain